MQPVTSQSTMPQPGEVWSDTLGHRWVIGPELPGRRLQCTNAAGAMVSRTLAGKFFHDGRPHPADLVHRETL